jgi:ribosomal protein L7Ae-like RNA K-turn-binding protein
MLMKPLTTLLVISSVAARIIFQYEEQNVEKQKGVKGAKRPSNHSSYCPEGADWCDEPHDYPEHTILKAVAKQKKTVKIMFENENIPVKKINKTSELGLRMFEPEEAELEPAFENICDVETTYIKPRAAKNKEGKFMFIVNHPEGADEYIQLVRVATCTSVGEECGQGRLATSVHTVCNQEYLDHKLVALSDTGEELVVDTFSFPSCCTCLINTGLEL